jgi:hypothetical protein
LPILSKLIITIVALQAGRATHGSRALLLGTFLKDLLSAGSAEKALAQPT